MIRRPLLAVAMVIALSAAAASTQAFTDVDSDAAPLAFSSPTWTTFGALGENAGPAPQLAR